MLVFTIIFDVYDTVTVSVYMLLSYGFSFNSKIEETEMYQDLEEIVPKIARSDQYIIKLKQNLLKISLEYFFMLNIMPLFILLYFE